MTETEWLTSSDPAAMLECLLGRPKSTMPGSFWPRKECATDRKLLLFVIASCEVAGEHENAVIFEKCGFKDSPLSTTTYAMPTPDDVARYWCRFGGPAFAMQRAGLLRDIFGNPWQPVTTICPWRFVTTPSNHSRVFDCHVIEGVHAPHCPLAWNDGTIPKIAEAIYAERAFDRMPVLADALEEAGCHASEPCKCQQRGPIKVASKFHKGRGVMAGPVSDMELWTCIECNGTSVIENSIIAHLRGQERQICQRCDGDGKAHGADRPFEWSADVDYGKCVVCRGTGLGSGWMPKRGPCVRGCHVIDILIGKA